MTNSIVYIKDALEVNDRFDFNYYHPKYNYLSKKLKDAKFDIIPLSKLAFVTDGDHGSPKFINEGILFIKNKNIKRGFLDIENEEVSFISEDRHKKLTKSIIKKGDVLLSKIGTIGNCCIYPLNEQANTNANVALIRITNDKIIPEYLMELLNTKFYINLTNKESAGSDQMALNLDKIKSIPIICPKKSVQKVLLKNVKKFKDLINDFSKKNNELMTKRNKIINSTILIKDIKINRINYYSHFIEEIDDRLDFLHNNPEYDKINKTIKNSKYKFKPLSKIVKFHKESRNPTKTPNDFFMYVDIGNINIKWGKINPIRLQGKNAISSRMRRVIREKNILISATRPTRKAICIVPKELNNQICSTGFAVLECKSDINVKFLFHILRVEFLRLQFEQNCSGSGYPAINQEKDLPEILIPVPPLSIQKRLVNKLEKLDKKLVILEGKTNNAKIDLYKEFENSILP